LLFKNYGQEVGDQYIVGPNIKVGGPVSPGPYGCCAYVLISHSKTPAFVVNYS